MKIRNNLLISLYRWCNHQGENFTTEAFTHLLCHLLDDEPEAASSIISTITGSYLKIDPNKTEQVQITAQPTTGGARKRPDIEIRYPDYLIFIEVKIDSMFGLGQMGSYLRELQSCGIKNTRLITITKHDYAYHQGDLAEPAPHVAVRWYQLADYLESTLAAQIDKNTSQHFVEQFTEFLNKEVVTMQRADCEIEPGVRSMLSVLSIIEHVLASNRMPATRSSGTSYRNGWIGYYFQIPGKGKCFTGIYLDRPNAVTLNTEFPVKLAKGVTAPLLGSVMGNGLWVRDIDLSDSAVGFFVLDKNSQIACIDDYVASSIAYVGS